MLALEVILCVFVHLFGYELIVATLMAIRTLK